MRWVTRARPKTDRIACPWLIRRFIDPDAEILYVPKDQVLDVARQEGARSFDADGAEFTHRGDRCSFEVLIEDFRLGEGIQRGFRSGAQDHVTYGRNEPALIHFHRSLGRALGLDGAR